MLRFLRIMCDYAHMLTDTKYYARLPKLRVLPEKIALQWQDPTHQ